MRSVKYIFAALVVFLCCVPVVGAELLTCGHTSYTYLVESYQVTLNSSGFGGCVAAFNAMRDAQTIVNEAKSWYAGCAMSVCAFADNCSIGRVEVWCPSDTQLNAASNIQQSVVSEQTVTGVALGSERQAAESSANSFFSSNSYPSVPGKVRTDGAAGFSYTTTMGANGDLAEVAVIAWKRGIYTNAGDNPLPLGDLAGSSGSGGASKADIQSAMESALAGTGNIAAVKDAISQAIADKGIDHAGIQSAFEAALENATLGGGGGGGGMTASEMATALNNQFGGSGFGAVSVPGVILPVMGANVSDYLKGNFNSGIQTTFDNFVTNIKTTGLYTSISGFFGGIPPSGVAPVVQIAGGRFGNHTVDFAQWASMFAMLGTALKVVFTFIGVRIVAINGV